MSSLVAPHLPAAYRHILLWPSSELPFSAGGPCSELADRQFGPTLDGCPAVFDFTLLFEQSILLIGPAALFVLGALVRYAALRRRSVLLRWCWLRDVKLIASLLLTAVRVAQLVEKCTGRHVIRTSASVPTASVLLVAACAVCALSFGEHARSKQPSTLLLAYLSFTVLADAVVARTYWRLAAKPLAIIFILDCCASLGCFSLEAVNKSRYLSDESASYSKEELSGPISKSCFFWLNSLFRNGYRNTLRPADLAPVDSSLYSKAISDRFRSVVKMHAAPKSTRNYVTFLADALISFLSSAEPNSYGYGLIGTCVFIYGGMAVATSWYWRQVFRLMTILRGGLVLVIFEKVLHLQANKDIESKASTMMISDVQRLVGGVEYLYEIMAGVLETALATYLLYRQLGVACFSILGLAAIVGIGCVYASKKIAIQQQVWLTAMQSRIAATKHLLDALKAVKMTGTEDRVSIELEKLRAHEIRSARLFRVLISLSVMLSYVMTTVAPPLVFGVYLAASKHGDFSAARMFSSMVVISLVGSALIHVYQALPALGSAYGCLNRLSLFLAAPEPFRGQQTPLQTSHDEKHRSAKADREEFVLELNDKSLGWTTESCVLRHVNLAVRKGSRIAIVGKTGSGKSLLIKSIVGEANSDDGTPLLPLGQTAYCAQSPWLENQAASQVWTEHATGLDKTLLTEIATCCALGEIMDLPDYEVGTIGSGGMRLSGGQRQRLALARTIALRKQVIILDDVFSAMDRATRELVTTKLLGDNGLFRRRGSTVIYTTHDSQIAALADEIYEIKEDGSFVRCTPETISTADAPIVEEPLESETSTRSEDCAGHDVATEQDEKLTKDRPYSQSSLRDTKSSASKTVILGDRAVYKRYFQSMGLTNAVTFLILGIAFSWFLRFPQLWLQWWSSAFAREGDLHTTYWFSTFSILQILPLLLLGAWVLHLMLAIVPKSATNFHSALLQTTLHAPFPFLSRLDTGELLNRFNQDLIFIDGILPISLFNTCAEAFSSLIQLVFIAMASKESLAILPVLIGVLYGVQHVYLRTSKQIRHMDLEWKGALHTRFSEACSGLATIRANGWVPSVRAKFYDKLDRSQEPFYLMYMVQRWLQLVLGLVVAGIAITIAGVAVALRSKISPGALGVAFLNVTTLGASLTNFIISWTSLETSLGAVARIVSFERDTPAEASDVDADAALVESNWPVHGHIQFENLHTGYYQPEEPSDGQKHTLRGVSFDIPPGQRVAVCGKTGSGKSTLLLALLRVLRTSIGSIRIDGVDIARLEPRHLQKHLTIVPQDALIDLSAFRDDLDPERRHTDSEIIELLKALHVWRKVEESGGLTQTKMSAALSHGEAQLISIAKLLLAASKSVGNVVILDEATSSLDRESALIVEEMIATTLRGKTVISVLHRPESAALYDQIVVLDKGVLVDIGPSQDVIGRCDLFASYRG